MDESGADIPNQPERKLHAETEEVVLDVVHDEDVILSGKFEDEFPYIILADGVSEIEDGGKYFHGVSKQAATDVVFTIRTQVNSLFKQGRITDEASLVQAMEQAFKEASNRIEKSKQTFRDAQSQGQKPPLNTSIGDTTATMAMLWYSNDGVKRWYTIGVGNGFVFRIPRKGNEKSADFIRDENQFTNQKSYNADDFIGKMSQQPHVQKVDYELGDSLVVATDGLTKPFMALRKWRGMDLRSFLRDRIDRRDWKVALDPNQNIELKRTPSAGAWHYGDDATMGVIRV